MIIQTAHQADAGEISKLCQQFGYAIDQKHVADCIQRFSSDPSQLVLVAKIEGQVIAWLHVFIAQRIESLQFAEIGGMVVATQFRKRGIGSALIEQASAWAQNQGVMKLRVRCADQREDAHKFYQAQSMTKSKTQYVYDKQLRLL